jgi:hypothetical protein
MPAPLSFHKDEARRIAANIAKLPRRVRKLGYAGVRTNLYSQGEY